MLMMEKTTSSHLVPTNLTQISLAGRIGNDQQIEKYVCVVGSKSRAYLHASQKFGREEQCEFIPGAHGGSFNGIRISGQEMVGVR